ncbi:MAG: hypothetical protein H0U82_08950 [Actinobacteria bacterium]|nr:hypothetical protein [Actinomycetota bacterium]
MSDGSEKRAFSRALPIVLLVALALATAVAYVSLSGGSRTGTPVAQGAVGGAFHPIAGSFEPDDTTLESCADGEYTCLEQAFGNISFQQGPKPALRLFDNRIASDADVETDCHRIVHSIGSAAFAKYDGSVGKAFSQGSASCASGYYHGILERAFVGVSTASGLAGVARTLCRADGIRRRGFLDSQCHHGLGHGLMIQTGYDLPLALDVCAGLVTNWDSVSCRGGVFMENVNTRYGYRSSWLQDDEPLYPCSAVKLRDRRACYLRSTTRVLELNDDDFQATAKTCAGLDPKWATFCFWGFGRDAVREAAYAPEKILSLCRLAVGAEGPCLYGAARTIMERYQGGERAAALCALAPAAERGECAAGIGLGLGLLYATNAGRSDACERLTSSHARACTAAAIAEADPEGRTTWG